MTGALVGRPAPAPALTPVLTSRWYAALALGVVAFTVYGSYVPFHYHARPWGEILGAFRWVLEHRIQIESRSDVAANFLLGVPLGFGLLGAARVDRPGFGRGILAALVLWPLCAAFAAAVEFFQLYFPGRTCSTLDILSQSAGSAAGLAAWVACGQRVTDRVRAAWADPRAGGAAGRFLLAYLGFVALVQLLPLDLTPSPAAVYHKIRDGGVTLVPFAEWTRPDGGPAPDRWGLVETWLDLVGLYLPVGLLAARLPGRAWRGPGGLAVVTGVGVGTGAVMEAGQLFVSRHPSATDALFAGAGVVAGWAVARVVGRRGRVAGVSLEAALVLGQAWFAVLAYTHWHPFNFGRSPAGQFAPVEWLPFADVVQKNYLGGLHVVLERLALFAPFGILAVAVGRGPGGPGRVAVGCVLGLTVALVLEAGQYFLPTRNPSTTDVITAAVAALGGAVAARRARLVTGRESPRPEVFGTENV